VDNFDKKDSAATQQAKGTWQQLRGRVREAYGALTDNEVDRFQGRLDQLAGFIAEKTGEARDAIATKLNGFARDVRYAP
jgi:uncharacterized protein YjbJ (UPF0337 family)